MDTVAKILESKPDRSVYTMEQSASVQQGVELMIERNLGALVVVDGDRIAGIVSERDYARRFVPMNRPAVDTPLGDIMSSPVMYVRPHQTREECMALMTENRLRHLPVMDDGRLIGLVSIGDLVKATIAEQQFIIEQLEHYIAGQLG